MPVVSLEEENKYSSIVQVVNASERIRRILVAGALALALVLVLLFANIPTSRTYWFVCQNTGAQMGYRQWFFGMKTGHWHTPSALETFMQQNHPGELKYRWALWDCRVYNQLGFIRHVKESGNLPIHWLLKSWLDDYVAELSPRDKKRLYDLLSQDEFKAIEAEFEGLQPLPGEWKLAPDDSR